MSRHGRFVWAIGLVVLACQAGAHEATGPTVAAAMERNDRRAVVALIENGADVNQGQADGMTALHWAAYHEDVEAVRRLLKAGANANAANGYQVTPLSLACESGNEAIVGALLDAGADPNARLRGGETALMTAARTGKLGPVRALLAKGADVGAKERSGQTALMWAAAEGHATVVKALLEAKADFRSALPAGFTPLCFAVREGRTEVVRVLLEAGADVNEAMDPKKPAGKGPPRGTSPLIVAVENGHFELAVVLLKAGADPNDQRTGFTPLHTLTWVRKPNRGDDDNGNPPPIGSGNVTSLELIDELVDHGAEVNTRLKRGATGRGILSRRGATAFLLAAMTADVPMMEALVKRGAEPSLPNSQNCTPLMAAAGVGCLAAGEEAGTEDEAVEAVKLALSLGNDINAVDDNGETAMHGAAYKNFPKVVQLLADRGAKIEVWNHKNKYGWTPLAIAEGYRSVNFKPSPETVAAIQKVMLAAGVALPVTAPPGGQDKPGYDPPAR